MNKRGIKQNCSDLVLVKQLEINLVDLSIRKGYQLVAYHKDPRVKVKRAQKKVAKIKALKVMVRNHQVAPLDPE